MATPTANPVPSSDPNDLLFNAEKLDEVVNGTAPTFTDRLGTERDTLAGLRSRYPLGYAKSYANTTQGLAGTTNGEQFLVRTADEYTFQNYYNNAGAATLIGTLYLASGERFQENSDSAAHAVVTDVDGKVMVSVRDDGVHDHTGGEDVLLTGAAEEIESTGSSEALMSLEDANGRTLLVFDAAGRPVLPGVGALLDNICSADIVKAKEYESFGDTAKSNYFYDKAKSSLAQRVRFLKIACWWNDDANTSFCRFPAVVPIDDDHGVLFFTQRHSVVNNGEDHQRVVVRDYTIDHATGAMTFSATRVIDQPATWATTGGYASQPAAVRIPNGAHAGRIVLLYNRLETDGKIADAAYERAMHCTYSDDGGVTWSAQAKVMGSTQVYDTLTGGSGGVVGAVPSRNGVINGCGNCFIRIPEGVHAGRLVCSMYVFASNAGFFYNGAMYSDDDGATWTRSTLVAPLAGGHTYDESALVYCPDGTIAMLLRCEDDNGSVLTSPGVGLIRSSDGGATWTYVGHVSSAGFGDSAIMATMASLAPTTGFSKIVAGCTTQLNAAQIAFQRQRDKFQLRLSYDNGSTFVAKSEIFHENDNIGYSTIARLANGRYVMAFETFVGNSAINVQDSVGLLVFNEAEIFHNSQLV